MSNFEQQAARIRNQPGFIAALDQSGGSTPGALRAYGIPEGSWSSDEEMFSLVHQMRTRIMTSPAFTGERIIGAILFEGTMDRDIEGQPTADYLWNVRRIVPILKVDKGLAAEDRGVQVMKPMPQLGALLDKANAKRIFGTKMRSLVKQANGPGIKDIVTQQFEVARQILAAGLVPIIEPEVDINSPEKAEAEELLSAAITAQPDQLPDDANVMLKLTIPTVDDFYADLIAHPRVVRVVALSGGYPRDDANARLARNHGMIASFSRALTESLSAKQDDGEFDAALDEAIDGSGTRARVVTLSDGIKLRGDDPHWWQDPRDAESAAREIGAVLHIDPTPYVQRLEMEFKYPSYTGMEPQKIEDAIGDLAALRGTQVTVHIFPTMKTPGGRLSLNDTETKELTPQPDGSLVGVFNVDKQGFYRVELIAPNGEQQVGQAKQRRAGLPGRSREQLRKQLLHQPPPPSTFITNTFRPRSPKLIAVSLPRISNTRACSPAICVLIALVVTCSSG